MKKALVILCGGKSSRMGTDKTFLPFGSDSLLRYQVARFQPYFDKIYVSVQDKQDKDFDYFEYCGCEEIPDLYPGLGPMGGLYSCLSYVSEDILYFNAVDTPFSDPELAAALCRTLEEHPEYSSCLLKNPQGEIQPLQGAYSKAVLPALKQRISEKRLAIRSIFELCPPHIYEKFHREEQFFNMNDPHSYYYGLQKLAQSRPGEFPAAFTSGQAADSPLTLQTADVKGHIAKPLATSIPVLSFAAKSGTGKTTYLEKLLPILKKKHLRIAVLKHDAHGFQMDKPGKDSYRLTQAGADHMILTSADQTAAIFTHKEENPDLSFLLSKIQNVDLILTEGYKLENMPKIELLRKGYNETPHCNPENLLGFVCDFPFETELPTFDLNNPEEIVDFILQYIKQFNR